MAQARRKQGVQVDKGKVKPAVNTMPEVCPLCGISSLDEMLSHLQSHAPVTTCQDCEAKDKGWCLNGDGANHFKPDVSLFYCSNCGRYAPVEVAPQD